MIRDVFRVAECGEDFLTRAQGEKVRARLVEAHNGLAPGDSLVIDFSDVELMTPSFADECFGKLAEVIGFQRFREAVCLTGGNETVRTLVNSVLAERQANARDQVG